MDVNEHLREYPTLHLYTNEKFRSSAFIDVLHFTCWSLLLNCIIVISSKSDNKRLGPQPYPNQDLRQKWNTSQGDSTKSQSG